MWTVVTTSVPANKYAWILGRCPQTRHRDKPRVKQLILMCTFATSRWNLTKSSQLCRASSWTIRGSPKYPTLLPVLDSNSVQQRFMARIWWKVRSREGAAAVRHSHSLHRGQFLEEPFGFNKAELDQQTDFITHGASGHLRSVGFPCSLGLLAKFLHSCVTVTHVTPGPFSLWGGRMLWKGCYTCLRLMT